MSRPLVDVRLDALSTSMGPAPHLADVSPHIRYGEFFPVLGPPHSGKTAILRAVAGFLPLSQGRVLVDAEDIGRLSPRARGIGYVFHQGALWPHLTVREHVAFGLEQIALERAEIERRVGVVLARLDLAAVADARPGALTLDGQRRVALAPPPAVRTR